MHFLLRLSFFFIILPSISALECYFKEPGNAQSSIICPKNPFGEKDSKCFTQTCTNPDGKIEIWKGCNDFHFDECFVSGCKDKKYFVQFWREKECEKCQHDFCNNEDLEIINPPAPPKPEPAPPKPEPPKPKVEPKEEEPILMCYKKDFDEVEGTKWPIRCPMGHSCFSITCGNRAEYGEVLGCTNDPNCGSACVDDYSKKESECKKCYSDFCNSSKFVPKVNILLLMMMAMMMMIIYWAL